MPALHHLAFRTHDVALLAEFYRDWLGLTVVRTTERSVWLALGEGVVMIEYAESGEPGILRGSRELFAVAVTEEARVALRARLVVRGMLEGETPFTLYFRDPDGRRVGASTFALAGAFER